MGPLPLCDFLCETFGRETPSSHGSTFCGFRFWINLAAPPPSHGHVSDFIAQHSKWITNEDENPTFDRTKQTLIVPLKPEPFGRKRHELDSPNLGCHLQHHSTSFYNLPLRRPEMGCGLQG
ncbi:hypothetical protein AVEN_187719-1 [Araneus ventricosus]|uniref:Uncharacterized protein n=1 Tax=Araneus ventricosus TaxID=182803 RepID=A0A4Y2C1N1_ARAVE|nr:hypothetical protein AVEN_187719-1 [Araneus ventricosus]